jgi:uncharacterized membrane protein SpoIIM required for sporulation
MARMDRRHGTDPRLSELAALVERASGFGLRTLTDADLVLLPQLYRYGATRLAELEAAGADATARAEVHALVARAHALIHRGLDRPAGSRLARVARFFLFDSPRAIRGEWKLIAASFALMYGLAIVSYVVVSRDLDLAYSLLHPAVVADEIARLQSTAPGEPFRGNFTFGLGESPQTSGWIMAHNMTISIVFFGAALVPPLYVLMLATNGLMLGTYTAVAGHWDRAGDISSILWCHGTLEMQAIVLSGAAGLVLVRAIVAPGPRTRTYALRIEGARAWRLLAPTFPMLFFAGLIEGFVSPHAPPSVRFATAIATGVAMIAWALLGGRVRSPSAGPPATQR